MAAAAPLDQLVQDCIIAPACIAGPSMPPRKSSVDWTKQFGTSRYDLAYAAATVEGGLYVAGFTNFALPGQRYHHRYDAFVRKYDADGDEVWTRQFGSTGVDQVLGIAADETGVVVVRLDGRPTASAEAAGGIDAFAAGSAPRGGAVGRGSSDRRADDRATGVALEPQRRVRVRGDQRGFPRRAPGHALASGRLRRAPRRRRRDRLAPPARDAGDGSGDRDRGAGGELYKSSDRLPPPSAASTSRGASDGFAASFASDGRRWRLPIGTAGADLVTAAVGRANGVFVWQV